MDEAGAIAKRGRFTPTSKTAQTVSDAADPFSLVLDTDLVSKDAKPPSLKGASEKDDVPFKTPIWVDPIGPTNPLATLTVQGKVTPIYRPIPGFEHLFPPEAIRVDRLSETGQLSSECQSQERRKGKAPHAVSDGSPIKRRKSTQPSKKRALKPRGVKRTRSKVPVAPHNGRDDSDLEDHDTVAKNVSVNSLYINDIEALKNFYFVRFKELTMKPLRQIVTRWVKTLAPDRQQKHGRYHRQLPGTADAELEEPPWWPRDVPYNEPSHLQLQHLIPLAVDIMLVHRRVDEEHGKRRRPWIAELKRHAVYYVDSEPTDTFSSSKGEVFNEAMKKRAANIIIPSLFDVAQSHEDYITMHDLFEGSGKEDPGVGKHISWTRAARPDRTIFSKRQRRSKRVSLAPSLPRAETTSEDSVDDTEVDERMSMPNSSFSSFQSPGSNTEEDVKPTKRPSPVKQPPSPEQSQLPPKPFKSSAGPSTSISNPSPFTLEPFHSPSEPPCKQPTTPLKTFTVPRRGSDISPWTSSATPSGLFRQSMRCLRLDETEMPLLDVKAEDDLGATQLSLGQPFYGPLGLQPMEDVNGTLSNPAPYTFVSGTQFFTPQDPISMSGLLPPNTATQYPILQLPSAVRFTGMPCPSGYPYNSEQNPAASMVHNAPMLTPVDLIHGLPLNHSG